MGKIEGVFVLKKLAYVVTSVLKGLTVFCSVSVVSQLNDNKYTWAIIASFSLLFLDYAFLE
jgi:hypothetical protein